MKHISILSVCFPLMLASPLAQGQILYNTVPTRILGQAQLQRSVISAVGPNLVEGREVNNPQAVAVDTSVSPPILYVADTFNSRVLAWKNATTVGNGTFADLVIGQSDPYSVTAQSAGSSSTFGFALPTAVVVDTQGNLYVMDAGNNRILRYSKPFSQASSGALVPDMVLGQQNLSSGLVNQGLPQPAGNTLALYSNSGPFQGGMAFDGAGNLWVTDPGNNRVLRFPAATLAASAAYDPSADMVLGQTGFTTNAIPPNSNPTQKNFLAAPSALAFDPAGNLFVSDAANRVLVFPPPFYVGQAATRIAGIALPTKTDPTPAKVSALTLGVPQGIFFIGANPFVVDAGNHRIVGYPPYSAWPTETTQFGPTATFVLGQADFASSKPNAGNPESSATTVRSPVGVVATASDVFLADAGNNRVLDFPISGGSISAASRVFGQIDFPYNAVNLIEGREFYLYSGAQNVNGVNFYLPGGGVAIDATSNPPHLYVADAGNNRILGFKDYRQVKPGQKADIVIGQPDFYRALVNYPTNNPNQPSNTSLNVPEGVVVDANGDLWVADSGNGRVVRFPKPFAQSGGTMQQANLVIGQTSFTQSAKDATAQTMYSPYGLAFTVEGDLVVSDQALNRVLFFGKPANGDFTLGQVATSVIGQPDFNSSTPNNSQSGTGGLNGPHFIALDHGDQLYVADTGNNRIAIYRNVRTTGNNPTISLPIFINQPNGVAVNQTTGEIWALGTGNSQVVRLPNFSQLQLGLGSPIQTLGVYAPLGLALDPSGNPVFTEGTNRVSMFYQVVANVNAANYFHRSAPGMLSSLFGTTSTQFGTGAPVGATFVNGRLPTSLGGVQVMVNGVAAPLLYVSPNQINFQMPNATPTGQQDIQAIQVSTNQVLADGEFFVEQSSPGLFTLSSSGNGQIAAVNADDNKTNSGSDPVKAGHFISIFGTGQGYLSNAPPDGAPAPGAIPTALTTQVYAGGADVIPQGDVQYSGLAPGFVGLWQINFKVPSNAAPGPLPVIVIINGNNSRQDAQGDPPVTATIYVSQ